MCSKNCRAETPETVSQRQEMGESHIIGGTVIEGLVTHSEEINIIVQST